MISQQFFCIKYSPPMEGVERKTTDTFGLLSGRFTFSLEYLWEPTLSYELRIRFFQHIGGGYNPQRCQKWQEIGFTRWCTNKIQKCDFLRIFCLRHQYHGLQYRGVTSQQHIPLGIVPPQKGFLVTVYSDFSRT